MTFVHSHAAATKPINAISPIEARALAAAAVNELEQHYPGRIFPRSALTADLERLLGDATTMSAEQGARVVADRLTLAILAAKKMDESTPAAERAAAITARHLRSIMSQPGV